MTRAINTVTVDFVPFTISTEFWKVSLAKVSQEILESGNDTIAWLKGPNASKRPEKDGECVISDEAFDNSTSWWEIVRLLKRLLERRERDCLNFVFDSIIWISASWIKPSRQMNAQSGYNVLEPQERAWSWDYRWHPGSWSLHKNECCDGCIGWHSLHGQPCETHSDHP